MKKKKMPYVLVRTYSAGVFAGYLAKKTGREVVLKNARRIWYWSGAASLSQLAVDGTADPQNCKFPVEVPTVTLLETIEISDVTPRAQKSIQEVPVWKKINDGSGFGYGSGSGDGSGSSDGDGSSAG